MASVSLTVEAAGVSALNVAVSRMIGQYEWIAARAMTNAAKAARSAIASEILPKVKGGATAWTRRGLIVRFASPKSLRAQAGFQYGEGQWSDSEFTRKAGGVAAGRYMGLLASGGDRRPKSTELKLRRAGLIRSDQFVTPASSGVRLNSAGNLSGPEYQRILSRVKAASGSGFTSNASSSGRSRSRRAQSDYFVRYGQVGEGARYIAARTGPGPKGGTGKGTRQRGRPQTVGYKRGFVPALFVVDQPNYERKFDIRSVALREYSRVFPAEFEKALMAELRRRG